MNKYIYIIVLSATAFNAISSLKAIDPVSIAVGGLVITGVAKTVDGLICCLSPSRDNKDYVARHERLKFFSKKNFIEDFEFAFSALKYSALDFLTQHELYKYPNFIEAIKETFPEYAEYIKTLMHELNDNSRARLVRGFETDHVYHKCKCFLQNDARDFSEFYELIKKLYAEVLHQEEQLKEMLILKAGQANTSQPDLSQALVDMMESNDA